MAQGGGMRGGLLHETTKVSLNEEENNMNESRLGLVWSLPSATPWKVDTKVGNNRTRCHHPASTRFSNWTQNFLSYSDQTLLGLSSDISGQKEQLSLSVQYIEKKAYLL